MAHRKRYRDLAEFFDHTGRTQEDLAERLGISQSHLSLIARRLRQPSLPLAVRIAELTGVAVQSLVSSEAVTE